MFLNNYFSELYSVQIALASLWITYYITGLILPDKSIIRPSVNISKSKLYFTLIRNTFIVFGVGIFTAFIPEIIPIYSYFNVFPDYLISNIFASLIKYTVFSLFVDAWFYYFHRLLHTKMFYKYHKQHHEYIQSSAISALYCGMVELILVNNLSVGLPMRIFGFSQNEMIFWSIFTALNVAKGHAGLQFTFSHLPTWLFDDEHGVHHEELTCNYGIMYIFDRIHGTYKSDFTNRKKRRSEIFAIP
jgi:sterol desaturase/sphingolipid hydroxylase (fatty acid hydroxylase superfamily)